MDPKACSMKLLPEYTECYLKRSEFGRHQPANISPHYIEPYMTVFRTSEVNPPNENTSH